ncbi:MAG: TIGR01777 family oxidoreductase, partial [Blastocatellia bacterium]
MKMLMSGATGLIGSALIEALGHDFQDIVQLSRSREGNGFVSWDPSEGKFNSGLVEGVDVVIHLAGESIAKGRWTEEKKARIRNSRVRGTQLLAKAIAQAKQPPRLMIAASAVGFYGDRAGEWLSEQSGPGSGFLADICQAWERAAIPAVDAGTRVVNLRIGAVLSMKGGALASMIAPFRFGIGGRVGAGNQYMSWIALEDVVGAVKHCISLDSLSGPVNAGSPNPVTNLEFTKALGHALSRPTVFPLPGFAARLALGEMASELLLSSARMKPEKLLSSGYDFLYPELDSALAH